MRRFWKSGLMLAFAAALLVVLGFGIWGLASDQPSPLKDALLTAIQPVQRGCNAVAVWFEDKADYMRSVDRLKRENQLLREKLAEAEARLRHAEGLEVENEQLRKQLDMQSRYEEYDLLAAEITGTESGNWGYRYLLDCGTYEGVEVGQCVICDNCIVGWIAETGHHWAAMETIVSSSLRAGGVVIRTREVGVMLGDYNLGREGRFRMAYLPDSPKLRPGDTVETSGAGGEWPAGFLMGTVESISLSSGELGAEAVIVPTYDLTQLDRVYIMRGFSVGER